MKRIIVSRQGAFGDVLILTPILHLLRRIHGQDAYIHVRTGQGGALEGNRDINSCGNNIGNPPAGADGMAHYDISIELDGAHEVRRAIHALDAYMDAAFGDEAKLTGEGMDRTVRFDFSPLGDLPMDLGVDFLSGEETVIAIHPNASWRNRTMTPAWWEHCVRELRCKGYTVVSIGTGIDLDLTSMGAIDTRNRRFSARNQAAIISASDAFLCGASGPFILAGATETPIIVPITISAPEICLPWRHDVLGWECYPIMPTERLSCLGCSARAAPASTFVGCERGDYRCIDMMDPADAVHTTVEVVRNRRGF